MENEKVKRTYPNDKTESLRSECEHFGLTKEEVNSEGKKNENENTDLSTFN